MQLPKAGNIEVVPSILSADFGHLCKEIKAVEKANVNMLHLDVMDGHFVPNLTIGPPVVEKIRPCTDLFLDAHLMVTNPEKYAPIFVKAGANNITFHIEVCKNPEKLVEKLHKMGATAGICLNPDTPVESIEKTVHLFDMVLVMTVYPGFGGQSFMPKPAKKIAKIKEIAGANTRIEVDGGIATDTAGLVVSYGADTLVAGSAVFSNDNHPAAIKAIRESCKRF